MAFLTVKGVRIAGVSASVPATVEENRSLSIFGPGEYDKFVASTGIERRHVSKTLLSSDLCVAAAERMLVDLGWSKDSVDGLVVVTQCPDYYRPGNATIVHGRLGLPKDCAAVSLSFGCSGWIYGLQSAAALISGGLHRVLLCCGEGIQAYHPLDKSTYPLFGSAGTCTALEADGTAEPMTFDLGTDGGGWKAIHIPDGGYRNPPCPASFEEKETAGGARKTRLNVHLDGMDVFSFGISRPPKSIKALMEHCNLRIDDLDYVLLHQANMFLNNKICAKIKCPPEKAPHNIEDFGNSSSATLPLLMVTRIRHELESRTLKMLGCAFGVGLSWGSVSFVASRLKVSDLVLVEDDYAAVYA